MILFSSYQMIGTFIDWFSFEEWIEQQKKKQHKKT